MTDTVLYALLKQKLQEAVESLGQPLKFGGVKTDDKAVFDLTGIDRGTICITEEGKEWIAKDDIATADSDKWEQFGELGVTKPAYFGDNTIVDNELLMADGTGGQIKNMPINPFIGYNNYVYNPVDIQSHLCLPFGYDFSMDYLRYGEIALCYDPTTDEYLHLKIGNSTDLDQSIGNAPEFVLSPFSQPGPEPRPEPCLIKGTLITMADGSKKPIEEVKSGDLIKSYNPTTKQLTNAVCISSYKTGKERNYITYNFTNGKCLTVFGMHGFYAVNKGTTKNIQNIIADDELLDIDLNSIYFAAKRQTFMAGEKIERYNLISSNNLYFANDILLGHKPYSKLQYYLDTLKPLSQDIKEVWSLDCKTYNDRREYLYSEEYFTETNSIYAKLTELRNIIKKDKQWLKDTDYKDNKYLEGQIPEEEWSDFIIERQSKRDEINEKQEEAKIEQLKLNDIINRYTDKTKTSQVCFEECCDRDNAIFETVKNYYQNK